MSIQTFFRKVAGGLRPDISFDSSNIPSGDEKAALAGEGTPSGLNKFTTKTYVDGLSSPVYVSAETAAGFTRTGNGTFTVTDNATNQGIFVTGLPVQYRTTHGSGTFYYGIIKSYVTGTVTILGPALPNPLGEFNVGPNHKVVNITLQVSGGLATGDDQLNTVMNTEFRWMNSISYCVSARSYVKTAAAGANLNIAIGIDSASNDLVTTTYSLGTATTAVDTANDISTTNYIIYYLDKVFVNIDQVGSTTPGADLTSCLTFIMP